MTDHSDNAVRFIEIIRRKAPEYVDLLTAEAPEDWERAFDALLEKAITNLERNKANYRALDEEGLTGVLAAALSMPGLTVSQETHSGGHVDITIEADHCCPARKKLGEAKIYNGPKYHVCGLQQLLGRYMTGRECRGLLIVYFRKKDIRGLISSLRQSLDSELPLQQKGATVGHLLKWSFISTHTHSCGENLEVCHVGCNLFTLATE